MTSLWQRLGRDARRVARWPLLLPFRSEPHDPTAIPQNRDSLIVGPIEDDLAEQIRFFNDNQVVYSSRIYGQQGWSLGDKAKL